MNHSPTGYVVDLVPVGTDEKPLTLPVIDWDDHGNPRVLWQDQLRSTALIANRYPRVRPANSPITHVLPADGWRARWPTHDGQETPVIGWTVHANGATVPILMEPGREPLAFPADFHTTAFELIPPATPATRRTP